MRRSSGVVVDGGRVSRRLVQSPPADDADRPDGHKVAYQVSLRLHPVGDGYLPKGLAGSRDRNLAALQTLNPDGSLPRQRRERRLMGSLVLQLPLSELILPVAHAGQKNDGKHRQQDIRNQNSQSLTNALHFQKSHECSPSVSGTLTRQSSLCFISSS